MLFVPNATRRVWEGRKGSDQSNIHLGLVVHIWNTYDGDIKCDSFIRVIWLSVMVFGDVWEREEEAQIILLATSHGSWLVHIWHGSYRDVRYDAFVRAKWPLVPLFIDVHDRKRGTHIILLTAAHESWLVLMGDAMGWLRLVGSLKL